MRFTVEHRVPGRVRVSLLGHIPATDACALAQIIEQWDTVTSCTIYPRTGSIAITHTNNGDARRPSEAPILKQLSRLTPAEVARHRPTEAHLQAAHPHQFALPLWQQIAGLVVRRALVRLLLPLPLRFVYQLICALSFIRDALHSLRHGRLDVPVLDAAAITTALIQRKPDDAGSIMFMLTLGETMEQHARGRTQLELIHTLLDMPELVWRLSPEGKIYADTDVAAAPTIVPLTTSIATPAPATEPLEEAPVLEPTPALEPAPTSDAVLVPATALVPGDLIVVRTSSPVPVDGKVLRGRALVNQNSLTGEPLPIERTVDDTVFAGTVVEEGELIIEVSATFEKTRIRQVVSLVEQSELLRPEGQIRLENLANRFVPYNFL
ncbi:MAG: hypothetical protein LBH56_04280, partial [Coriobacteriales bacterium]|nr:hypothetical protein [Coriobacteriales bacterium]